MGTSEQAAECLQSPEMRENAYQGIWGVGSLTKTPHTVSTSCGHGAISSPILNWEFEATACERTPGEEKMPMQEGGQTDW